MLPAGSADGGRQRYQAVRWRCRQLGIDALTLRLHQAAPERLPGTEAPCFFVSRSWGPYSTRLTPTSSTSPLVAGKTTG